MAQPRTTHARKTADARMRSREARRVFFKADRPRAIDDYIDYFGGAGGPAAAADDDLCGETLLERLA